MSKASNLTQLRQDKMREVSLQNKEKERVKQEKETKQKRPRSGSTHLFTSMTVSGTTICSACSKRITAKEALNCAMCSVTVHSHCQDSLPECCKTKHRQQKPAIINSSLQNVTMKNKAQRIPERPSSAIYPSDTFRRSGILATCRGRGLSLSKSVSSNNIAGFLNEDSSMGLRRILSQSTDSLIFRTRALSVESLSDDEVQYNSVLEETEVEGQHFKADSWSLAVDRGYLQKHHRNVIKRQDVIYELIQTELHHMQTLRILEHVYRQGLMEELHLDQSTIEILFPRLDYLCQIHGHFLAQLLQRRTSSLESGSACNYTIHRLGDILLEQFSGQPADDVRQTYAEFCTRHLKAVKQYKELLSKDKRLQSFIQRVSRSPLLRRHGYQECILLVTQRICKYPVLIQRLLDSTLDDADEASCLAQALLKARELLTSIEQQMEELQKTQRVQEIHLNLDGRVVARVRDGRVFRPEELLRRRLIYEGTLFWKSPGSRLKEVQVLLMTDILVFLQEKDQKYIFTCLDKPPVLSLQNLLVRTIANQERGMFCISDASPPEMYELHAASKDDRNLWIHRIQHAVSKCPSREEFPLVESEHKARIRRLKADLQQKDSEVLELLHQRVTLFSELAELSSGQSQQPANTRSLFRADTLQAPRAERLLLDATVEVDRLSDLLLDSNIGSSTPSRHHLENVQFCDSDVTVNGAHVHKEICQRLLSLSAGLHALQGAVIKQDSILELLLQPEDSAEAGAGELWRSVKRDSDSQEASSIGELALLQRQHSLLQDELVRLRDADSRYKESERARTKLQKQLQLLISTGVSVGGDRMDHGPRQKEMCAGVVRWESQEDCSDGEVEMVTDDDDDMTSGSIKDLQAVSRV